jgi:hypothetical protein
MAIGTALAIAGAGAKAYGAIDSAIQNKRLMRSLEKLQQQPIDKFTVTPQIENLYRQAMSDASNPEGFGGATTNAFRQNLGRFQRGRFNQALNMSGGSGARGINAVLNNQGMDSINQFAVGDENLRRSNRLAGLGRAGSYASQFQNIKDRNTQFNQNYRMQLENALGQGIRSNRDYIRNTISGAGSDLITSGLGYDFGNFSGEDTQEPTAMSSRRGTPDPSLLSPRARYMAGRNPFRENAPSDILTYDQPVNIDRRGQSKFMYGNG